MFLILVFSFTNLYNFALCLELILCGFCAVFVLECYSVRFYVVFVIMKEQMHPIVPVYNFHRESFHTVFYEQIQLLI